MPGILITGGSSYLGQHLVPLAAAEGQTFYTFHENDPLQMRGGYRVDIRDETAVSQLVSNLNPETIIHTVGSNRPADMANIIVAGTTHITEAARNCGARLIHISTDVIFNGREAPYGESAGPTPIHAYGHAKAQAEAVVRGWSNHVIIRTSLIYGLRQMDRGTAWMAQALRAGEPVTLFSDQRRNPIWVMTLCHASLELTGMGFTGTINIAGRQEMSRAEFSLRMLDWWEIGERDTLQLGHTDADRWPVDCTLSLDLATSLLKTPLLGVDEVLQQRREIIRSPKDLP